MADVRIEYDSSVERAMFRSPVWQRHLKALGFTIVSHAVTETGVDTGALRASMSFRVENEPSYTALILGSGADPQGSEVWYAAPHWAKQPPTLDPPVIRKSRKQRPHPTKKAPAKPWSKALAKLGIKYKVEPGGFES